MAQNVLLNNVAHRDLRVRSHYAAEFGDNVATAMIVPTEFSELQRDYPIFVEAYDQIDLSVGYDITDQLAVSFEAINIAGEDVRWHGRSSLQMWRLEDQGARYALGARYKF